MNQNIASAARTRRTRSQGKPDIVVDFAAFDRLADLIASRQPGVAEVLYENGVTLIEAKDELLEHGEFQKFLEDPRVDIELRTAERMMRIARQEDGRELAGLGIAKATILVEELPAVGARKSFMADRPDIKQIPVRDLKDLIRRKDEDNEEGEDDLPATTVSKTEDVWICGRHRYCVGDARKPVDVDRLMAGETADLGFTDPPYNVGYEGYTKEKLTIQNDRMTEAEYKQLLEAAFRSYRRIVKPVASLYVFHACRWQGVVENALNAAGFEVHNPFVWVKDTPAYGRGRGRVRFQHEMIFYCHVVGQIDAWYVDLGQPTVWFFNKPAANRDHPMMKPVALIKRALSYSSKEGDIVVDLFAGSGSTLIACEHLGRTARLMDSDPRCADVSIRRWQRATGKRAILEGDGRTFDEIARERRKDVT